MMSIVRVQRVCVCVCVCVCVREREREREMEMKRLFNLMLYRSVSFLNCFNSRVLVDNAALIMDHIFWFKCYKMSKLPTVYKLYCKIPDDMFDSDTIWSFTVLSPSFSGDCDECLDNTNRKRGRGDKIICIEKEKALQRNLLVSWLRTWKASSSSSFFPVFSTIFFHHNFATLAV